MFDLKTYAVLAKLAAAPDADGIIYDPGTDRTLISAGDSNALVTFKAGIDPQSGKIDAPIPLEGAPEFLAADGHGEAFVNLEDKDVVAVVDLTMRKVIARWSVVPGGGPVGMSMDLERHRLFIGCRKPQQLVVMNAETGKVEDSLPTYSSGCSGRMLHDLGIPGARDWGLSICKTIVESAGGSIEIESEQGKGTIVKVHLAFASK